MSTFFWVMMGIILAIWGWTIYECKVLRKKDRERWEK
jgi:hypothetical protein